MRRIVVLGCLLLAAGGCGSGFDRPTSDPNSDGLLLRVTVLEAGECIRLRATARNVTEQDLFVCTQPTPFQKEGWPYVYYAGRSDAVVFSAITSKPAGTSEDFPCDGAIVQRLGPGKEITFTFDIPGEMDEHTPWGSLFSRSAANPLGPEGHSFHEISRIFVVVGYWEDKGVGLLLDRRRQRLKEMSADRALPSAGYMWREDFVFADDRVPEAMEADRALGGLLAQQIRGQTPPCQPMTLLQAQNLAVTGPIAIKRSFRLRCLDVFD